jgi:hypothetical protein
MMTETTALSQKLRSMQAFGPDDYHLLQHAADNIDGFYNAMLKWKRVADIQSLKRKPLTESEIQSIFDAVDWDADNGFTLLVREIEKAHGIGESK